jgi:hypothetical protein
MTKSEESDGVVSRIREALKALRELPESAARTMPPSTPPKNSSISERFFVRSGFV